MKKVFYVFFTMILVALSNMNAFSEEDWFFGWFEGYLDVVSEMEYNNENLDDVVRYIRDNYYYVYNLIEFPKDNETNEFREFAIGVSYMYYWHEVDTAGYEIGNAGINALYELYIGAEQFQEQMDDFKETFEELSGLEIYETQYSYIDNEIENNESKENSIDEKIAEIENQISDLQKELNELKAIKSENTVIEDNTSDFTLYDNEIKIELTGISASNGISLYAENNSNLNLGIMTRAFAINGYMIGENAYGINSFDVASGMKANATEEIEKDTLYKYGVNSFDTFDALFWAYDNDKGFKEFDTGQIHTELTPGSENDFGILGETVYENDGIRVDYIGTDGTTITYCLTNTSGNYAEFSVENLTINDYTSSDMYLDLYGMMVLNNCQLLFEITPEEEFLNTNGITDIYSISFTLSVIPLSDYFQEWNTDMISKQF